MNNNSLVVIKNHINHPDIKRNIEARLGEKAGTFITSLLDVVGEDRNLAECDPNLIVREALKAAGLDLPINRNLGFAYVLPYKEKGKPKPQFQMGYKGYIQLAIRTGQYRHLNAGVIYEGEEIIEDRIKGTLEIGGEKKSEKAVGYFCYMELLNGFNKAVAWTREKVQAHAKRFSKSYSKSFSPWKSDFDAMAMKTMVLQLVPKYGPMTIEMSTAMVSDRADFKGFDNRVQDEIDKNSNRDVIDIPQDGETGQVVDAEFDPDAITDEEKAEIKAAEAAAAQQDKEKNGKRREPGF